MVLKCAFPGCPNREKPARLRKKGSPLSKDERLTFHTFPLHDSEQLKLWLLAIQKDTDFPLQCVKQMKLCSKHFSPDDFQVGKGTIQRLKASAVPNHFLKETSNDPSQLAEGSSHDPQSADQPSTQHEGSGVSRRLVLSSLITCPSNSREVSEMDKQQNKLQEEVEMSTEDLAHCTEDLVIAKVEDVRDEMPMDVDKNLTGNKQDKPEENKSALEIKNETTDMPAGSSAQPELTSEKQVNIKDEPMDEEYENASTPQRPMGTIKDEPDTSADFNQTQDEFKIGAVFSVGGKTVEAPAATPAITASLPVVTLGSLAPALPFGVICTGCKKVLLKGQTAFQRKGSSNLYCSPQCLCSATNLVVKMPLKKICSFCYKEIDPKDLHTAADASGVTKDFCSKRCLNSSSFRCSRCQKKSVGYTHQVNLTNTTHKLCSEVCFIKFRAANNVSLNSCMNCNAYCHNTDGSRPALQFEDSTVRFCNQICLTTFLKKSKLPVACKMCRNQCPAADMVKSSNPEGIVELFCTASCATANRVQNVSSSGAAVECNSCKKKLAPQYHLAMSDGTIQNFCSFSCVVTFQDSLSKKSSQNQLNTLTSSSNSVSVPAAAKSAESSSSAKTNAPLQTVTKIPCAQCLLSFYHKPDLLEFKKKMYAFCGSDCIEEFKRINNVMARCEYCKIDKIVREVKRINKIDRCFCSEGCKLLYNHELVKRWGKKHCRNCVHCNGSAQTLVTSVIAKKQQEFCGNVCLTQYKSLFNQQVKCSMCKQAKKMNETVKWMGEIKHFCSLQCLMFFCSLQGTTGSATKAANKTVPAQGTSPVSILPQATGSRTAVGAKEATSVIANVISLSSAPNGHAGVLGNTILQGAVPASTVKGKGHLSASSLTDAVKAAALPPKILKNKALLCKPLSQNKGTSCKPNACDANTQTDAPSLMVLPVPVPVYVPVPMNLYTQYTPRPVGLPLPVPVPLFFPTTLDSAERIVETIQEIKEKIPDDPLEADLIMMAEMVAEDAEKEKQNTTSDQTENLMDDLDLEALSNSLSWEEESVSSAQTWDQALEHERTSSKTVTLTLIPSPTIELQMDLEADFPVESIEHLRGQKPQEEQPSNSVKQKPRRKGRDGLPQKKRGRKCAPAVVTTLAQTTLANNLSKLQHEYGIRAWRDWVLWRNSQPHMETPKFGSRSMTLKEDMLKCSTAELSFGLSRFISEVRRPNGDKYSPDSIFYLCLCIQKHLFENERMENIFADFCYSRFCQEMTNMLKEWTPTVLPSGYVHSRIEEEYLWDCKQLGAFSPNVLLNTLLYFFTKFFNYKTVEQHRRLSFSHVIRCSRNKSNNKEGCLRFYPPKDEANTDGVLAKRRKEEDDKDVVLEVKENSTNPLRCPVRLYEFYLSKCSPTVRNGTTQFYLNPERSCVPCSPMWFSTSSLSDEALENMLTRILTVRELHLQQENSIHESDGD